MWERVGPSVGTLILEAIYSPIRAAYCEITCLCQTASHLGEKNKNEKQEFADE
jgi:hypothetical protein